MTSRLTQAVLDVVAEGNSPFTAQGITSRVRKRLPTARHVIVLAEVRRLVGSGRLVEIREPRLPARFALAKGRRP